MNHNPNTTQHFVPVGPLMHLGQDKKRVVVTMFLTSCRGVMVLRVLNGVTVKPESGVEQAKQ